jgi:hypothetical protein
MKRKMRNFVARPPFVTDAAAAGGVQVHGMFLEGAPRKNDYFGTVSKIKTDAPFLFLISETEFLHI